MKPNEKNPNDISWSKLHAINKLGYALTATALLFANTDKSIGDLVWTGSENQLIYEEEIIPGIETWVIVPGLGVQSGSGISSTLKQNLNHRTNLAYFNYSDDGANIYKMAQDISALYDETKAPINFYAHSMGSSITFNVLKNIDDKIPINNIIFDCSPYDVKDAYNPATPIYSEILPIYGGGFISKIGAEALNNTILHENKRLSLFGQIKDSSRIAITGSSPRLFTNQLGILGDTNGSEYAGVVPDSTRILYLKPEESSEDETVNVDSAIEKYKLVFGSKIIVVNIKNGKHASPTQRPSEYNAAIWPYINGIQEEPHQK